MLVVREEQLRELGEASRQRFHERAGEFLARHSREFVEGKTPDELRRFLQDQEVAARSFGIATERDLVKWFYLASVTGGRLAEAPECRRFLADAAYSAGEKMNALLAALAAATVRDGRSQRSGPP